jgi:hypothetical protein
MTEQNTAAQALAAVMADVHAVGKDNKSGAGYQYRSIDGLINGIAPAMHRHGLILVPNVESCLIEEMPGRKGWVTAHLTVSYWVYGPDGSSLEHPVRSFGLGPSNNPGVAPGIALSYAYKAAVSQLLCIPTDDPAMDTEHTMLPEIETITDEQFSELRRVFDTIEDPATKADAKAAWVESVGDPRYLHPTAFAGALASAQAFTNPNQTKIEETFQEGQN